MKKLQIALSITILVFLATPLLGQEQTQSKPEKEETIKESVKEEKDYKTAIIEWSIFSPWEMHPGDNKSINGLHLMLPYGRAANMNGLALGYVHWVDNDMNGVELDFFSYVGNNSRGVQASFLNYSGNSMTGVQPAFVNIAKANMTGVQPSFVNYAGGNMTGIQPAFVNYAGNDMIGFQPSFVNFSNNMVGLQTSFLNIVKNETKGAQVSYVNYSSEIEGLQLGFINYAKKVNGAQVGLINISHKMEGVPVGLINIVLDGSLDASLWSSLSTMSNMAVVMRASKYTYAITMLGYDSRDAAKEKVDAASVGFGFGIRLPYQSFFVDFDYSFHQAAEKYNKDLFKDKNYTLTKIRVMPGYQIMKQLSVFGGFINNSYYKNKTYNHGRQVDLAFGVNVGIL
ncbi:MAG: hypothetical protein OEZ22_11955 [Spirochaetia bacterium]|nr:hypothetical protein [Spirochaetia bacterium]